MDHTALWTSAKLAARNYAADPSKRNALRVEMAWQKIRAHNSQVIWEQMKAQWLAQGTDLRGASGGAVRDPNLTGPAMLRDAASGGSSA